MRVLQVVPYLASRTGGPALSNRPSPWGSVVLRLPSSPPIWGSAPLRRCRR